MYLQLRCFLSTRTISGRYFEPVHGIGVYKFPKHHWAGSVSTIASRSGAVDT